MSQTKKTILIVEDELDLCQILKKKFEYEGFNIIEAHNGEIGLNIALKEHPDLILLDIIMPIMDGMTMLKKLREDKWGGHVPVIILTNLNETKKVSEGIENDVYSYLVKSNWELDDIVSLVRKNLGLNDSNL